MPTTIGGTYAFHRSNPISVQDADDTNIPVILDHFGRAELYEKQLCQQCAAYILRLKSFHGLSQSCINDIVQQTEGIVYSATSSTRERLLGEVKQDEVVKNVLDQQTADWSRVGDVPVFQGIDSSWLQQKYFREKFGMLEPVEVKLGERRVIRHNSRKLQRVPAVGYYVPFLDCLQNLTVEGCNEQHCE